MAQLFVKPGTMPFMTPKPSSAIKETAVLFLIRCLAMAAAPFLPPVSSS